MRLRRLFVALVAAGGLTGAAAAATETTFAVSLQIDASAPIGELKPIWRFFGCDEPNYASMKDGRKLLGELGELEGGVNLTDRSVAQSVYFRSHNLLCNGDGTPALKWGSTNVYSEDAQGNPVYDWRVVDHLFDTYLARGVRPYAQIGFMPEPLSTKPEPYQHAWRPGQNYNEISTGWAYPPKDYAKWGEVAYQWVKHCVEKYGRAEVEQWFWEVWNEANGAAYWHGSPQDFYKLHDYAIAAVRRALPTARVGGPDSAGAGGAFTRGFLDHCLREKNYATGAIGTPLDFISFHAKGSPRMIDGRAQMGIAAQLRTMNDGFAMIASFPELKRTPIVIGESDPDGCAGCTASVYPQNSYRNGAHYASYTAATFGREQMLADKHGVNLEGALTWAFEFEDQPYFAGFRVLATNGIDLPVLNVFRMLAKMHGTRVATHSSGEVSLDEIIRTGVRGAQADVAALAAIDAHQLAVLVWHYHDDEAAGPDATVELSLANLPAAAKAADVKFAHYRIDDAHSNAFTAWKKLGSPSGPSVAQYKQLVAAGALGRLDDVPATVRTDAPLKFTLPRQAVSLLVFEWP
jgi:xylan 1,4-beta-xylosidase